MALLRYRWWNAGLVAVWCGMVCLPLLAPWLPGAGEVLSENRKLAAPPKRPENARDVPPFLAAAQAWLNDHFGFRSSLLAAYNRVHYAMFHTFAARELVAGRDGFVFLGADGLSHHNMIRALCGADRPQVPYEATTAQFRSLMLQSIGMAPNSYFLVVPDKSRLQPDKLPRWLQQECAPFKPPFEGMAATLAQQPDAGTRLFYPIAPMRSTQQQSPVYPAPNFHWDYPGALPTAVWLAEGQWKLSRRFTVPLRDAVHPFDMQQFAPGLTFDYPTRVPRYDTDQVLVCHNKPECFPEFPEVATQLVQVARFRSAWQHPPEHRRPRLVIFGDSFGEAIADPLAPYFAEVWYFSMNELARLSPAQRDQLRHVAIDLFAPDVLLHVYHEATVVLGHERYLPNVMALMLGR